MVAEKKRQQSLLGQIARRIAELERAAHENLLQMDYHERKAIFEEIDSLVELHERTSRVPTWPFDRDILVKFVTPQLFSVFSLVGLAEPIIAAVQALIGD